MDIYVEIVKGMNEEQPFIYGIEWISCMCLSYKKNMCNVEYWVCLKKTLF